MKKSTLANAAMVFVIAVVLAFGVFAALQMRGVEGDALGSEFRASALSDNRLVTSSNPENTCTVIVRCETVLDNLDLLNSSKVPYVPSDGGYPTYGSSSYDVQNGDVIEWRYTCVGLGEDIGAERVDGK